MRLVIDLQACQDDGNPHGAAALAQALALARTAGARDVWIALDAGQPARIDALRQAFAGLLPADRVRVYQTPARDEGGRWRRQAAELVRDNFLLGLQADAVYAPALFDGARPPLCAAHPQADLPTAFSVYRDGPAPAAGSAGHEGWQRRAAALDGAALLLAATPDLLAPLRQRHGQTRIAALAPQAPFVAEAAGLHDSQAETASNIDAASGAQHAADGGTGATADDGDDAAARRLWPLFDALRRPAAPPARRPRLAYVSPLPPEKSGIADYSADVIPALAQFYDIELIAEQADTSDPYLRANFALRSPAWFERHTHQFDRIVYHFGNNPMHSFMFELLPRHPGTVILHDFYLADVIRYREHHSGQAGQFALALYQSHGYTTLQHYARHGAADTTRRYPVNHTVLDHATGVIVHSAYARALAERWYGADAARDWSIVTLPRRLPAGGAPDRAAARAALGLAPDDCLVCSFGMLGATKLNVELVDAFLASPLGADPRCKLVFVGHNATTDYGIALEQRIAQSDARRRIAITGFVDAARYAEYAAAADIAVQLRSDTRGETSAAILDCLLHGAATIINAHGAGAELPDDVLLKLPDQFTTAELGAALARLRDQPALRARLGAAGAALVRDEHAPLASAHAYRDAIEQVALRHPRRRYRALTRALGALPDAPAPDALLDTARAIAWNQPPAAPRQLFVDISALIQSDYKTGIQRVVRSILQSLIDAPPAGMRVEPVYGDGGNRPYRYARRYMRELLGLDTLALPDDAIDCRAGDTFLGLDLHINGTSQNEQRLLEMRTLGVHVHFVLYDMLPVLRPDWFAYGTEEHFRDYLDTLVRVASGVVGISRSVAEQLQTWAAQRPCARAAPLQIGYFHLGADIDASQPSFGLPPQAGQVFAAVAARPTLLMVGTIEPRKGHAQALAAFELLWQRGVDANLVIIGKHGWMVEQLVKRLDGHPEAQRRLFWLQQASDEMLLKLYQSVSGLLAASEGEGFGLPLIEAAQHGLPVIARGLPVFREIAGGHAYYFDGLDGADLAAAIDQWLALHAAGQAPPSTGMAWLSWQQSAAQLLDVTLGGRWHDSVAYSATLPQLYVDVSAIARNDLQTGIERVVRAQLVELLRAPDRRYQVRPVYLSDEGGRWHYRHARQYLCKLLGSSASGIGDDPVQPRAGDIYYGPDFYPSGVVEAAKAGLYRDWRGRGVQVNFLIHDLLPVLQPQFFPPRTDAVHAAWLACIAAEADRLVCISAAVADETRGWMAGAGVRQAPPLAVVHHGADISASRPSAGLPPEAEALLATLAGAPAFLMVGTIEPRKGHLQALDAFERLWAEGVDAHLVIVGREGWVGVPAGQRRTVPAIIERLRRHPQAGQRLHWLAGISDEYLERVYAAGACLLVPSEGEGFGLPLIEAARHGLPILARDLPVFREVAGQHAAYFSGADGAALARALSAWLAARAAGATVGSAAMPWLTWAGNVQALARVLLDEAAPAPPV